jgi:phospholipase/carboxylesterase
MWKNEQPLVKIGSLDALDFPVSDRPTFVLFHGFGANAYDLAPLRTETGLAANFRWLFPQGPLSVDIGGGYMGRAWFPVNMEAHERAAARGEEFSYADVRPPGLNTARDQALSMLKKLGVSPANLILGGFSQGAMLALELALVLPERIRAAVLLSGVLVDKQGLRTLGESKKGLPFFQSHGEEDMLLPFGQGKALNDELENAGWQGTWCPFRGGHEIPRTVLQNLSSFLRAQK